MLECFRHDAQRPRSTAKSTAYPLTTQSVLATCLGHKPNLAREIEEVEYSGSELATCITYITDETGIARCFMEARLGDQKPSNAISIC